MLTREAAEDFVKRYEKFWRDGAKDLSAVYVPEAILCGYEVVKSIEKITAVLEAIIDQGWRDISIEILESNIIDETILLACQYTARSDSDQMVAKSSYVLIRDKNIWKAAMHTAI